MKFAQFTDDQGHVVFVNPAEVRYVGPAPDQRAQESFLMFNKDWSLLVEGLPDAVARELDKALRA